MKKNKVTGILLIVGYVLIFIQKLFFSVNADLTMMLLLFMTMITGCLRCLELDRVYQNKVGRRFFKTAIVLSIFLFVIYFISPSFLELLIGKAELIIFTLANACIIIGRLMIDYFDKK